MGQQEVVVERRKKSPLATVLAILAGAVILGLVIWLLVVGGKKGWFKSSGRSYRSSSGRSSRRSRRNNYDTVSHVYHDDTPTTTYSHFYHDTRSYTPTTVSHVYHDTPSYTPTTVSHVYHGTGSGGTTSDGAFNPSRQGIRASGNVNGYYR